MSAYIAIAAVCLLFGLVTWKQQQTIDRLTNKLMSRDYREYTAINRIDPVKPRDDDDKPKSWFDH